MDALAGLSASDIAKSQYFVCCEYTRHLAFLSSSFNVITYPFVQVCRLTVCREGGVGDIC